MERKNKEIVGLIKDIRNKEQQFLGNLQIKNEQDTKINTLE